MSAYFEVYVDIKIYVDMCTVTHKILLISFTLKEELNRASTAWFHNRILQTQSQL